MIQEKRQGRGAVLCVSCPAVEADLAVTNETLLAMNSRALLFFWLGLVKVKQMGLESDVFD